MLIQSTTTNLDDAAFRAAVADVTTGLAASGDVQNLRSPLTDPGPGSVSADRRSALVTFDVRGEAQDAAAKIAPIVASVDAVQSRHRDLYVGEFGAASARQAINGAVGADLKQAGILSIPITLGILLVAFGALVAAGIPLLLALTAVVGALGLVGISSYLLPADPEVAAIVLLIGLAVGVDYSMFYLKREREERAAGRSPQAALAAAAATSGRSVLISGLTVMVAMAGMFLTGGATFASFGLATMMVVAVAMVGSLTVLPALLSRLGDNVDRAAPAPPGHPQARRRRGPRLDRDHRARPAAARAVDRAGRWPAPRPRRTRPPAGDQLDPPTPSPRPCRWCRPTTACSWRSPERRSRPPSWSRPLTSPSLRSRAAIEQLQRRAARHRADAPTRSRSISIRRGPWLMVVDPRSDGSRHGRRRRTARWTPYATRSSRRRSRRSPAPRPVSPG